MAVQLQVRHGFLKAAMQFLTQAGNPLRLFRAVFKRKLDRFPETRDRRDIFGAGSHVFFLVAAVNHGLYLNPLPDVKWPRAFWPADLVRRYRNQDRKSVV